MAGHRFGVRQKYFMKKERERERERERRDRKRNVGHEIQFITSLIFLVHNVFARIGRRPPRDMSYNKPVAMATTIALFLSFFFWGGGG